MMIKNITTLSITIFLTVFYAFHAKSQSFLRSHESATKQEDGYFGRCVVKLDDLNNDGIDDIAIGALGDNGDISEAGTVLILSGDDGSLISRIESGNKLASGAFGTSMAYLGGVSGSGTPMMLIGASREKINYFGDGRCYLSPWDGQNKIEIESPTPLADQYFGQSVCALNDDMDGDGNKEFVIASAGSSRKGLIHIYEFNEVMWAVNHVRTINPPYSETGGEFANAVAPLNDDANNDGINDLIVGAHFQDEDPNSGVTYNDEGRVYVIDPTDGSEIYRVFSPNSMQDGLFGSSVAPLNDDANNDGVDDFIVGAIGEGNFNGGPYTAGHVYVVSGKDGAIISHMVSPNADMNGRFGYAISSLNADVSGDGVNDVIVGAHDEAVGFRFETGRAYIMNAVTGDNLLSFKSSISQDFGYSVAAFGDLNNNGKPDFLLADPAVGSGSLSFSGKVYIIEADGSSVGINAVAEESFGVTIDKNAEELILEPNSANHTFDLMVYNYSGREILGKSELKGQQRIDISAIEDKFIIVRVAGRSEAFKFVLD